MQAVIVAVPPIALKAAGMPTDPGGNVILAVALMSIVFTAPFGALAIKLVGERVPKPAPETSHATLDALSESR